MFKHVPTVAILAAALALAGPAAAQVAITQAKAQAGNVTPGDTAGRLVARSPAPPIQEP